MLTLLLLLSMVPEPDVGHADKWLTSRADAGKVRQSERQVAVVIDDFGNGMDGTNEMMELPIHFTAAVMPFMPTTRQEAELLHKRGHEVIVHLPMEPVRGKPEWLGPGAITTNLSDKEIRKRVEAAINDVPHASGMNNHMGSKATADERVMRIVLSVVKEHGMFFLDSRTTYKTVVPKLAAELGVELLSNQVFLDDIYTMAHIARQVGVMSKHLESNPSCVVIGHVGPPGKKTAAVLKESIPRLKHQVSFVRLSEMLVSSAEKDIVPHS
ncbi:divergent polysaccharide deacetylase family protein [Paenibacillus oenotherae]|uniref:Divergent polysaccharide deacetylase family protein n=2 Tax=Paenibacillus oenotherae TaxID=1435645 RepID=A0ABS7D322_9BACL|nr:divergent polysaccharide deacetylase family protein [Paenibacillus oenotherae]